MRDDILDEVRSEVKALSFGIGKANKCTRIEVEVLKRVSTIRVSFCCSNAKAAKNMIVYLEKNAGIKLMSCQTTSKKTKTKPAQALYSCEFVPSSESSPMRRMANKNKHEQ